MLLVIMIYEPFMTRSMFGKYTGMDLTLGHSTLIVIDCVIISHLNICSVNGLKENTNASPVQKSRL